jgi:hypothetical protein
MNKKLGGVHFEEGRGYRATLTANGMRIRSQRMKTRKEATEVLERIRRIVSGNDGTVNYSKLNKLEANKLISVSIVN